MDGGGQLYHRLLRNLVCPDKPSLLFGNHVQVLRVEFPSEVILLFVGKQQTIVGALEEGRGVGNRQREFIGDGLPVFFVAD